MNVFKEPKNVDFSTKSASLTVEEHKEISDYIKKQIALDLAKIKRKRKLPEKVNFCEAHFK